MDVIIQQVDDNGEIRGKTYTLFEGGEGSHGYYSTIRDAVDLLLERVPDEKKLLSIVRSAHKRSFLRILAGIGGDSGLKRLVIQTLHDKLSAYTEDAESHLKSLSVTKKFDTIIATRQWQYHLYMAEIELVNRIYADGFRKAGYRFALIGHCLRDFRPACQAVPGDVEEVCEGCTEDCFVNLGSQLMSRYGIHPYISVEMDQERLFRDIKARHPSVGALGIACVPELAHGMRLCIKLGIPAVGVPLDANRCSRWMGSAKESSFNLSELEELIEG